MTVKNFVNFLLIILGTMSLVLAAINYNNGGYLIGRYSFGSLIWSIIVGLGLLIVGVFLWE